MNKIKYLTRLLKKHEKGYFTDSICVGENKRSGTTCEGCFFNKGNITCFNKEDPFCNAPMEKWLRRLDKAGVVSGWNVDWARWNTIKAMWKAERKQRKLDKEKNNAND